MSENMILCSLLYEHMKHTKDPIMEKLPQHHLLQKKTLCPFIQSNILFIIILYTVSEARPVKLLLSNFAIVGGSRNQL